MNSLIEIKKKRFKSYRNSEISKYSDFRRKKIAKIKIILFLRQVTKRLYFHLNGLFCNHNPGVKIKKTTDVNYS